MPGCGEAPDASGSAGSQHRWLPESVLCRDDSCCRGDYRCIRHCFWLYRDSGQHRLLARKAVNVSARDMRRTSVNRSAGSCFLLPACRRGDYLTGCAPGSRASRLATISVAMSFFFPAIAVACECAPLSLAARVDHAHLVLVGSVSSFEALDHVTVQPVEVFKGSRSKSLTIETGRSDCDFFLPPVEPRIGEEYLLYLRHVGGSFECQSLSAVWPCRGEGN